MEERESKKYGVFVFLSIIFLIVSVTFLPSRSFAGDMEILLDDLVNKGVLTKQDAENLLKKMQEKKTKEMEKVKAEEKAPEPEWVKKLPDWIKNPPDWIKNTKISGDLRLRYEYSHRDTTPDDDPARERGRFRWRVGATTQIIDDVTVGFGLSSGSSSSASSTFGTVGDPRSTEQTLDSSFSKKPLVINYAFAQYKPIKWLSLLGGKLQTNPIFRANSVGPWPSELAWDNDITPEGAAVVFNYPAVLNFSVFSLDVFMNNAFFILDENNLAGSGREPYMFVIQPGFNLKIIKDINFKAALAKYVFSNVERRPQLKFGLSSNTLVNGRYQFNYDSWIATAEFGYNNPFGQKIVPYVGLFGEYIYNPDPEIAKRAYIGGIRVGYPSLKKFGDWQLSYAYRRLDKDAWLDTFLDSTFYSGAANSKGHKGSVYFGLTKNLFCDINYFHSVNILENSTPNRKRPEDVFQADIQFNF
jgi:hypothetical protein